MKENCIVGPGMKVGTLKRVNSLKSIFVSFLCEKANSGRTA